MKALKLNTDGRIEVVELNEEKFEYNFQAMQKAIDCETIDIVHAVNLPEPYCMVVDDEGLFKEKPYINLVASYLYGIISHGQPIVGDVIIMKDKFTDDGIDTVGLEPEDVAKLLDALHNAQLDGSFRKAHEKVSELVGDK